MLDSKNFIKQVGIAKNIARSSSAAAGAVAIPSILADGEVVVTDINGTILNSGSGANGVIGKTKVQIRQARGIKTPPLKIIELSLAGITSYQGAVTSAAVDQVTYIGYDGATGDFEATSSNEKRFIVKITPTPNSMVFGLIPFNLKDTLFVSAASTTKTENAIGMTKALIQNFSNHREIDFNPKFELVASDAGSALTNITNVRFTKYSKSVTVTATGAASITAGSYIKVNDGSAATRRPVYRVATGNSIGGAGTFTIILEWAFQGESINPTGNTGIAAGALTTVGVKISGRPMRYDVVRWRQYDRMRFNVDLANGFTTTTVSNLTPPFDGVGTWQQAMNDEYISWGDEGQINPMQLPYLPREQDVVQGSAYSVLNIGWQNSVEDTLAATGRLKGNVVLYLDKTSGTFSNGITGAATSLVNVLDAFVTQRAGFTNQIGNL